MTDFAVLILVFIVGVVCGGLMVQSASNSQAEKGYYSGNGKVYSVKPVDMEKLKND